MKKVYLVKEIAERNGKIDYEINIALFERENDAKALVNYMNNKNLLLQKIMPKRFEVYEKMLYENINEYFSFSPTKVNGNVNFGWHE